MNHVAAPNTYRLKLDDKTDVWLREGVNPLTFVRKWRKSHQIKRQTKGGIMYNVKDLKLALND